MYVKSIEIKNFRCFEQASMEFQYPGRRHGNKKAPRLPNVNLILGDNGSGKSSVLKAMSLSVLSVALSYSGFRSNLMVRRQQDWKMDEASPDADAHIIADLVTHDEDNYPAFPKTYPVITSKTDIQRKRGKETLLSNIHFNGTEGFSEAFVDILLEDTSQSFFLVGYGATRRAENSETFDLGARERSRSLRYQRIASLFEDYYSLVPASV